MRTPRLLPALGALAALSLSSCFDEKIVAPEEFLPPMLAVDRPTVQLFRFARGRSVVADTVRITNNGEGPLGGVDQVGGVDYITETRTGWLRSTLVNLDDDQALLILRPTYAEEEQDQADVAEVVLKAANSTDLKRVRIIARTLRGATFEFSVSPLTFAAAPGDSALSQWLTVRNGGNGTLLVHPPEVHYRGGVADWVVVERSGGSDKAPEFRIDARPPGLPSGLSEAYLVFRSTPQEETRANPDSVRIQLSISEPVLTASVTTLAFTAIRGAQDPPLQTVLLSNSGEGGFEALGAVQIGAPAYGAGATGWLETVRDGEAIRVRAGTSSLEAGDSEASFRIQSEHGGSRTVQVSLSVQAPTLTATPLTVSFGLVAGDSQAPGPQTVALSNTGAGTFADLGTISLGAPSPAAPWLSAALVGQEVVLTPTSAALSLGAGSYETQLPVQSDRGGSVVLSVTMAVSRGNDPPQLALSATAVDFAGVAGGASPASQAVQASNSGGGILGAVSLGTITYGGPGGWLDASLAGTTITLTATTGALANGTYTATVPVTSTNGGSAAIAVTFALGAPVLTASASSASFSAQEGGGDPPSQVIVLSNTGSGTFASLGTVALSGAPPAWLGTALAGDQLTLSVATGALAAGTYSSSVPVISTYGGNLSIDVTFTVTRTTDAADLVASPASIRMDAITGGGDPPSQDVALSNGGGGTLGALSVSGISYGPGGSGWLGAGLVGSSLTLSATTGALGAGSYSASVGVSSANGGSESVAVTLVVGAPVLTLSSGSASFAGEEGGSASPASLSVGVSNTGSGGFGDLGAVSLGATGAGWLGASLGGGGTQVDLSATIGALGPGTYTASVPVNSTAGGSASIAVTLTVTPRAASPVLELSAASTDFFAAEGGGDPSAQDVAVSNSGGGGTAALGALSLGAIAYGSGAGWLSATLTGTTVTVAPATGALTAGTYTATVPVQSANGGSQALGVTFTVTAATDPTDLVVSPGSVRADAVVGGGNPPGQAVNLYNGGGGTLGALGVGAIVGAPWLSAALGGSVLTLSFNSAGLVAGTYNGSVEATSASGGNETVAVTLVVAGPVLTLSSASAGFSGAAGGAAAPASISVQLSNTGAGDFSSLGAISLGGGIPGWLSATLAGGDTRVDLSASIGALAAGSYNASVPVLSGNGGSGSIDVTLTVAPTPAAPVLALSASTVDFTALLGGGSPSPETVLVSNGGGGSLAELGTVALGTITYGGGGSGWLAGSSLVGSTLTLVPATGALAAGSYSATVPVTSQFGGNASVAVTATVGTPVLTASSLSLSFTGAEGGAAPGSQGITLSNTGAGDLADLGSIAVTAVGAGAGWLTSPSPGPVVGGALSFSVDQGAQPAGAYSTTVDITSQHGGSQTVGVSLTVVRGTDPPQMVLSPTSQRFDALVGGGDPPAQSVAVSNAGGGTLGAITVGAPGYVGGPSGWLQASLSGTTITTRATTGALPAGTYTATVPVSSAGGSANLDVTFAVGTSRLTVSPRAVSFGDTAQGSGPLPATVTLANTGGGAFANLGTVSLQPTLYGSGGAGWLEAELTTATTLRLRAITGSLSPRQAAYEARVPVAATLGGTDTVHVSFTVAPGSTEPRLALSLSSLAFSATVGASPPPPQTVEAFNAGGGSLGTLSLGGVTYGAGAEGWLQASVDGMFLLLSPRTEGIAPGSHSATVLLRSQWGGDSTVEVTLTLAAPVLSLSTGTVTFSDTVGSPDLLQTRVFLSNTGAGNREALGTIRLGGLVYSGGSSGWLSTSPGEGQTVGDFQVGLTSSAAGLGEGSWQALVPVISQWGGADTIAVSFTTREPDRSFDLPTIELVRDSVTAEGVVRVPLPGDSVVVGPAAPGATQLSFRVGVRNGSRTRLTLSGLRVGIPSYPQGQPTGWITGAFLDQTSATFEDPTQLFVVVEPRNLSAGRYEGRLVISSQSPGLEQVTPRVLRVILVVG